jgi:DNA primase
MASRIPDETITQITDKLDIVEVVGGYLALTKKGNRYWGLCPFHNEKTPSFAVTPEKGVFYCFGCHKGGSILTFIMEVEKLTFPEAVELAARKAGVDIKLADEDPNRPKREAFIDLYGRVARSFAHILKNQEGAAGARQYLAGRKVGTEIQERFLLGYAPRQREWLHDFLHGKNFSDDFLAQSGLFQRAGQSYFSDRIMFPIVNARQEVVAFGGRSLTDAGPKYLNTPETSFFQKGANLYGINNALDAIKSQGFVYLVEGYLDVMAMHASGIAHCVAPLGTALTERQARLLKRYCSKAVLLFDGDEAGINATLRALEICEACDLETAVVETGTRKDPAEVVEKDGAEALHKMLKCSINGFHYILKRAMTQHDVTTPRGKEGVVTSISSFLAKVQSQIRKDAYIEATADAIGAAESTVRHDLSRSGRPPVRVTETMSEGNAPSANPELLFMLAAAIAGDAFGELRKKIRLEDLDNAHARALFIALE